MPVHQVIDEDCPQELAEQERLAELFVLCGHLIQAEECLRALDEQLDLPAEAVEIQHIARLEFFVGERCEQEDPVPGKVGWMAGLRMLTS